MTTMMRKQKGKRRYNYISYIERRLQMLSDVKYTIDSYVGAGPLKLGMTRVEVRQVLDMYGEPTTRTGDPELSDYWPNSGIDVSYEDGRMDAIQFLGPVSPSYEGQALLGMNERTAIAWLKKRDPDAHIDGRDTDSLKLGISMWLREKRVTTVLVFRKGYWDADRESWRVETGRST